MKCNTPIDSATGMPLSGTALETALKDPNSPRCGRELSPDDIFCPGCGAKVKSPPEQASVAPTDPGPATCCGKRKTHKRATRANLWGAAAAFFVSNILYLIISGGDFDSSDGSLSRGLFLKILGYVNLFAYAYFIKTSVRRLHDMARSGWWMLPSVAFTLAATVTTVVAAVSGSSNVFFAFCDVCALVFNLATVAWLGFAKGTQGPNKYGPDPRAGADVPIGSDVGNAKEGEMTGRVIGNADSSIGGRGLAAEDNASSSNDMDAELMVKPRTRSISRRDLIAWSVVAVIVVGVVPFMFQDHSNKEKMRVCDMLTHNLETTRGDYATLLDHYIEKAAKSKNKATLDGMFGVEFGERISSDAAVFPGGDGTWLAPFEPAAPELAFSGYYKIVLPKTRVVCGIAAATEFSETEKEKCLATYETYKKNIGQSYGEMATLNRKPGSYGANGSEQVCQSIVECAAKRIITLEIVKSVGGGCMLRLCALDISMTENVFEESKQAAAELPSLDGLFGMKLGMRIEPTEKEEMLAEGYGVQLFTPDEPFLDFEFYAIKILPKSRKAYEIVAVHTCKTRFAASESFTRACRQMENMFKQKMTDITACFNTTGPDEDGEQRIKAVMITFPNSLRFLLIEQVRNIDDGAFRVRITAHDKKLFDTLESEVKAMEASDVSGFATLDADGKAAKVPPGINESEEVSRLRKAAEQGDASAQYNLGVCYANGKGVEQDKQEAVKWYRKAAEQGYAKSQCQLGFCYARGEGVAKDMNASLTWFRKAAEQGDGAACYEIGQLYQKGLGRKADMSKAAEWYRKGAELGDSSSSMEFGLRCLYGDSDLTPKDYKKAMELFQKSIKIDRRPLAYYCAGLVYYYGTDGVPDYKKAIELFKEASTLGVEKADYFLGICYEKGQGVSKDPKEAVKWYRKASERGFADAEYSLGLCLLYGKGVPREPDEAANWFQKAANHGNLCACYEMGRAYERGNGRTKDMDKAAEWYQKGADGGNPACCSQLGYRYLNGDCNFVKKDVNKALALFLQSLKADPKGQWAYHGAGLAFLERGQSPSDFQKAAEMFRKAADIGLAQSQHYLGKCYEKGQGVSKDPKEAVKWYRKAAEQGYVVSEYNLGVCYRDGWGTPKDIEKAADWFEKAARHGNVDACYEMGKICRFGNQDMDKATEWYQKGAERGHPSCCCQLGFRYFWKDNNIVKQDYRKALELFEKAIEGGIPLGYYGAGRVYFSGLSGKPDYKKALEMFEEGARLGDLDSVYYIGYCHRNGLGVKVDKEKAVQCYLKSSGGYPYLKDRSLEQLYHIGNEYLLGRTVGKDEVKAFQVYEIAAKKGSPPAMDRLGECYEKGLGVEEAPAEAVKWYRKAAEQGYAKSQCQLGFCYARGEGVAKDMNESLTWFHKAAEQGDGAACYEIAEVYRKGLVGKADMNKAAEWYRKGTELGHSGCAMSLGFRYLYGESDLTPKNHKKAMELFQKSIEIDRRPWGYYGAGLVYYYGETGRPDYKKAIEMFKEASAKGVEKADYSLGICYENGNGVEKDVGKARTLYEKAAAKGCDPAKKALERLNRGMR